MQELRKADLFKLPGVAEAIAWAKALTQLDTVALNPQAIDNTLGVLLKYQDDLAKVRGNEAARMLEKVEQGAATAGRADDRGNGSTGPRRP